MHAHTSALPSPCPESSSLCPTCISLSSVVASKLHIKFTIGSLSPASFCRCIMSETNMCSKCLKCTGFCTPQKIHESIPHCCLAKHAGNLFVFRLPWFRRKRFDLPSRKRFDLPSRKRFHSFDISFDISFCIYNLFLYLYIYIYIYLFNIILSYVMISTNA